MTPDDGHPWDVPVDPDPDAVRNYLAHHAPCHWRALCDEFGFADEAAVFAYCYDHKIPASAFGPSGTPPEPPQDDRDLHPEGDDR